MVYQIKNTGCKFLLVHPSLAKTALSACEQAGLSKDRIFLFSDEENKPLGNVLDWRTIISSEKEAEAWQWEEYSPERSCDTVATINYSSGTTGLPKGVCVSHYNLIANVEQTIFMRDHLKPYTPKTRPPERWLGFLPLYHAFGQLYSVLMACKLNVPVYIMKNFQYENFLFAIQNYKITHLQTAPPILIMLSKRPETKNFDLSSLTNILCGAAPLSKELQNDVAGRFGTQINQGWGMTEVTCGALHVPGGMNDDTGSVGLLFPNVDCKLLDDNGNEVKPGERGELCVRGPMVCMRYWKNEEATKEAIDADGWLKSGDVAICDKKGMFWIVDRKKELIKVNGLQVAPAELEAALLENQDVADAAVVGITL
jgi:4-coumarate--CoA ligase